MYTSDYKNKVNAYLNVNYPIGKLFHCYYTFHNDNVIISLDMYDPFPSFVAGLVFLSISGLFLLFWMIIECCICSPYCWGNVCELFSNCCLYCRRKFNKAREIQFENRERRLLLRHAKKTPPSNNLQISDYQSAPSAPPADTLDMKI